MQLPLSYSPAGPRIHLAHDFEHRGQEYWQKSELLDNWGHLGGLLINWSHASPMQCLSIT